MTNKGFLCGSPKNHSELSDKHGNQSADGQFIVKNGLRMVDVDDDDVMVYGGQANGFHSGLTGKFTND